MTKISSFIINLIIKLLDGILKLFARNNLIYSISEKLEKNFYNEINVKNFTIKFYAPTLVIKWRFDTILSKEPETIEWIDGFNNSTEFIFWDIGANVGLYSLYTARKYKNSKIISFEPSTSNLRVLSRNISLNNLSNKISINQLPLFDKNLDFNLMKEKKFIEGGALNAFSVDHDYQGKKFFSENSYKIMGTSINYLIDNNILEIPDYIKIDVDGIEHLILLGASKFLMNKKIKSICIELNEDFKDQLDLSLKILKNNNFVIRQKKHADEFDKSLKFSKIYNYIFDKKNS